MGGSNGTQAGIAEAIAGHGGIAGVQRVLCGRASRRALRSALSAMLTDPSALGPCTLRRAKFRTDRRISGYYDVRLGAQVRSIGVTWTPRPPEPASAEQLAMEAAAIECGLAAPFTRLSADVGEAHMRIEVSPLDPAFPQLVRLSAAPDAVVTPIRYRPRSRHLLRCDRPDGVTFVKLYRSGEKAAKAYRVASLLADRLASLAAGLGAARPLGYSGEDAVVSYAAVAGVPLSRLLRAEARSPGGASATAEHLRATGRTLGLLRADPGELAAELTPHSFEREAGKVASACEHIHTLLPAVGRRIDEILERALQCYTDLASRLESEPAAFVHGDLKADHLFVTRGGLVLIDFDTCYRADPAHDVGKLLADLRWWEGTPTPFLDAYGCRGRDLARARAYEALIFTKILAHRILLFDRDWEERTRRLVAVAESVLDEAVAQPAFGR